MIHTAWEAERVKQTCLCIGPRYIIQGVDRRPGADQSGDHLSILSFCRRCNKEVTNKKDIEMYRVDACDAPNNDGFGKGRL